MEAREIAQEPVIPVSLRLIFNLHFLIITGSFVRARVCVCACVSLFLLCPEREYQLEPYRVGKQAKSN